VLWVEHARPAVAQRRMRYAPRDAGLYAATFAVVFVLALGLLHWAR
jgi:hypothetical protein